ncbi:MAG: threonine--tRNA ligase [Polyangiaceae bacterium]|nr:threonine--tRNA ligase [Polyangiaceae bacterium]
MHPSSSDRRTLRELLAAEIQKDPSIVGARVPEGRGSRTVDLHTPIAPPADASSLKPIRASDPEGLHMIRHSTAHVLADAVQRLFPGTKVTFGPATDAGFYYDFDSPKGAFNDEDLAKIEATMKEIVSKKRPFVREVVAREAARALFDKLGETYKCEHIERLPANVEISLYRHGSLPGAAAGHQEAEWLDLCEGPHVPDTGFIGAIKLTSVAGAYWRGDERNPMLQRVYGTSFASEKDLADHLKLLEEAKERDHRKLGKELELFMFHEYAPAMPFLLPKGAFVYNRLVSFMRELYVDYGYEEVMTPQIFDKRLFETSGHLPNYRENMYLPMTAEYLDEAKMSLSVGVHHDHHHEYKAKDAERDRAVVDHLSEMERLGLKPMNCPSHCLIFGSRRRSYRELPWRMADFGRLHRYERGGVVHGLARVRSFCQDDAHIFCSPETMFDEIRSFIRLLYEVYAAFRFERVDIKLATRPDKRIGSDEQWDLAEKALPQALDEAELAYEVAEGEGAFYGPKLEFHIHDALKRSWQLGTLQVDYALPDRFELDFIGADGAAHRPVMLHRAILGSLERFLSVLIEHVGGNFPTWLAPEQVTIVTVSEKQAAYAEELGTLMTARGLRARADLSADKLGAKIRAARLSRVPYVAVVGDKEVTNRQVAPRSRDLNKDLGPMGLDAFIELLEGESRAPRLAKRSA